MKTIDLVHDYSLFCQEHDRWICDGTHLSQYQGYKQRLINSMKTFDSSLALSIDSPKGLIKNELEKIIG